MSAAIGASAAGSRVMTCIFTRPCLYVGTALYRIGFKVAYSYAQC